MPEVLRGKETAQSILKKLAPLCEKAMADKKRPPGLAIVQVGDNPASTSYIRQKKNLAEAFQVQFRHVHLKSNVTRAQLESEIDALVADRSVDAILLQLPLGSASSGSGLNKPEITHELLERIPAHKDADGLHSLNQGRVFTGESLPWNWTSPIPCTPLGIYRLLEQHKIPLSGKRVTVVGASRLVGMPVAGILRYANATVTLCHSRTVNLHEETRRADIIVAAAGRKHMITPEHITRGVTIIDVGINATDDGKITGDVHPDCYELCHAYSPVPGGVGPMTVGMLLENTLRLYLQSA